jgi:DNA polymerase-3 subunit delta
MELDYFNFINKADISSYKFFIISGDEPLQKHNVIEKITSTFKQKGFEIVRHDLTEQNHSSLYDEADSLSLFSMDKFVQFSMDKPPQKSLQKALTETLCKPSDNIYLVIFGQLKKPSMSAKWFLSLNQNAVHIKIYNPNTSNAIQIVKSEILNEDGLQLSEDAIQILVQKTEGNLIATKQILKLLGRQKEKKFDINNIRPFLHEHSSHDVFDLSDALLYQNRKRTLTILNHILQESDKPPLILWAIKKELKIIYQLRTSEINSHSKIFKENNVWPSKQKYYSSTANKISKETIILNLKKCLEIDLCIKGVHKGNVKLMLNEVIFDLTQ